MRTTEVAFFSGSARVAALWRTPDDFEGRLRPIVQGPGWMGLKDAKLYVRYHEALTAAGFGVLIFDYRGFGDSEGDRSLLSPTLQLEDLFNAVTYVCSRGDVDADAVGVFGSGGTGGGNAVLLAALDERVKAAVSQYPVADGRDWLHRMRSEHEWLSFLEALAEDRRARVTTGKGRLVHPREEIMVPTPERRATKVKADVDDRVPSAVSLTAADEILRYRPIDAAATMTTPLLLIGVENDATTPTDHCERLFEAARGPKELILQRHTSHYAAYDQYWETVTPRITAWFDLYLRNGNVVALSQLNGLATVDYLTAP
jgi:dipeptidyl aminopeptidase/acylaminoacyl peptidase